MVLMDQQDISLAEKVKKLSTQEIIGLSGLGLIGLAIVSFLVISSKSDSQIEIISQDQFEAESKVKGIFIDVSGAVERPGLYHLDNNGRVNDALVAAGGLSSFADREWVAQNLNLAAVLKDGQKIYIRATSDIQQATQPKGGQASDKIQETNQVGINKININIASQVELERLTGVGPATAQKIIDYRNQQGSFSQIEDIMKVSGIGEKTFEKFQDKISVW